MQPIENELKHIMAEIPKKYRATILEYAKSIKMRAEKGKLSDTEYLENTRYDGINHTRIKY